MRYALVVAALLVAALANRSSPLGRMAQRAPAVTRTIPRPFVPPTAVTPAPVEPLATLPPEDADWVLDHVERAESVRVLDDAQRARLIAQLISVRMHDVAERTEPYEP